MDHLVYVAASGARDVMVAQATNAHNLANASTSGFRGDLLLAQSAQLEGLGVGSRAYNAMPRTAVDTRIGTTNVTGVDLDIAINGEGWITVMGDNGTQQLSRRGDLRVNELGQLLDGAGKKIVGSSGPIALPPHSSVSIGSDGTISIVALGESPNTLSVVDRIKLVKPDKNLLEKGPNGMVQVAAGQKLVADDTVTVTSGSLESSNVQSVAAMVRMIELARQHEGYVKLMKTAEELDRSSAQLMSMS